MKQRFYHSSPKRFKKGHILICPHEEKDINFNESRMIFGVYLTTTEVPHFTLWRFLEATEKRWFVYEVAPVGKIEQGNWNDVTCDSAIVVKRVGNAKSILQNYKKNLKKDEYGNVKYNRKCYVDDKSFRMMKKKY